MIALLVKDGDNLRVVDDDIQRLREFKGSVAPGEMVEAEFRTPSKKATTAQSRLFHSLLNRYAHTLGYDAVYAKHELCILFGTAITMGEALQDPPAWSGYAVEYHSVKYLRKSTTQYTTTEYKVLIDGTVHACVQACVNIEDIMRGVA